MAVGSTVFWQPTQDFGWGNINYRRLHEILNQVGWRWSEICRVTAQVAVFFFKSVPIPDVSDMLTMAIMEQQTILMEQDRVLMASKLLG